jgi:hypothetical protein
MAIVASAASLGLFAKIAWQRDERKKIKDPESLMELPQGLNLYVLP